MTRPADIPQWAWDEALLAYGHALQCDPEPEWIPDIERIARALLSAYERGRGEQRAALEQIGTVCADNLARPRETCRHDLALKFVADVAVNALNGEAP